METRPVVKREFMAAFDRFEPVVLDHTAVKLAMDCYRKYFYRIVLGRVPRTSRYQVVFDFGSAYHKFREILEREFQKTGSVEAAGKVAFTAVLSIKLHKPGQFDKFVYLDEVRLLETCRVAFKYWEAEKKQGKITVLGIEMPWNAQLPDGEFTGGRMDQLIKWNGQIWNRDFKTTSKALKAFQAQVEPNDQADRYIYGGSKLVGEQIAGTIFEAIYQTKTTPPTIFPIPTQRTARQLKVWEEEQVFHNKLLNICREEDKWPMQKHNCSWCDYAEVCRKGNEQSMMANLQANYKLEPWNHQQVNQGSEND